MWPTKHRLADYRCHTSRLNQAESFRARGNHPVSRGCGQACGGYPPDSSVATRLYVSVDGGMSDNARPALYGAHYSARIVSRVSDAPPALVRVVGKHCESGDIVVMLISYPAMLPPVTSWPWRPRGPIATHSPVTTTRSGAPALLRSTKAPTNLWSKAKR